MLEIGPTRLREEASSRVAYTDFDHLTHTHSFNLNLELAIVTTTSDSSWWVGYLLSTLLGIAIVVSTMA